MALAHFSNFAPVRLHMPNCMSYTYLQFVNIYYYISINVTLLFSVMYSNVTLNYYVIIWRIVNYYEPQFYTFETHNIKCEVAHRNMYLHSTVKFRNDIYELIALHYWHIYVRMLQDALLHHNMTSNS